MERFDLSKSSSGIERQNIEKDLSILGVNDWPENEIERADEEVAKAASAIRLYYYRQIPLLRQIPYLMLEASKHGDPMIVDKRRAYSDCLMPIHLDKEWYGYYDLYLELRSGTIVKAGQLESLSLPGKDRPKFNTISKGWDIVTDREVYKKLAYQDKKYRFVPEKEAAELIEKAKRPLNGELVIPKYRGELLEPFFKENLDRMMKELPEKEVVRLLKQQGFDL